MHVRTRHLIPPLSLAASLLAAQPARAEGEARVRIDWGKVVEAIGQGGATLLPRETPQRPPEAPSAIESHWAPRLSVVARDWGGAQLLVGRLSLTDQIRLTRSVRMVVTRVRLAEGPLAPFAQLGLGQWRVDNEVMPTMPRDTELAGQIGGGFELRLAPRGVLAIEFDYTVLYRETHEPQQVSGPHILGAFLAARTVF